MPDDDNARKTWEQTWEEVILGHCLDQARREFRPKTWSAFEQVALQGRSPVEVADRLGMSRNSVFIAKHRVLKRLRELQADCDVSSAG